MSTTTTKQSPNSFPLTAIELLILMYCCKLLFNGAIWQPPKLSFFIYNLSEQLIQKKAKKLFILRKKCLNIFLLLVAITTIGTAGVYLKLVLRISILICH
jgi:hypothetical protein